MAASCRTIQIETTLESDQPQSYTLSVSDAFDTLMEELNRLAPAGLDKGWHDGGYAWGEYARNPPLLVVSTCSHLSDRLRVIAAWADTQAGLVNNVFNGFKICFPAAFLTLLVATHNLLLSVFAIVTVAGIVACVLGFCKAYLDWGLGVAESIAAVIVIGFAVDFTVHLAHMYVESDAVTRTDRMVDSGRKMGVTVVMGALTTLGAGCFLWMCTLTFFTKFAILIISTICFSLTAALLFFMPLVATFGPEGDAFDVSVWLGCGGKERREEKEPPPRGAQQAGEEKQP